MFWESIALWFDSDLAMKKSDPLVSYSNLKIFMKLYPMLTDPQRFILIKEGRNQRAQRTHTTFMTAKSSLLYLVLFLPSYNPTEIK